MNLINRSILDTSLPISFRVAFEVVLVAASYDETNGWDLRFGVCHKLFDPRFVTVKVTIAQSELEAIGLNSIRDRICEKAEEAFVQAVKQWHADATKRIAELEGQFNEIVERD